MSVRESEILFKARSQAKDFSVRISREPFSPQGDVGDLQASWNALQAASQLKGAPIWEGTYYRLVSLNGFKTLEKTLELGTIPYSTVRALIERDKQSPLGFENFPLHLNTGALIRTTDGYYIFGQKGTGPRPNDQRTDIIGGGLQSSERQVSEGHDLARNLLKEMYEEINIGEEHLATLESLGFVLAGDTMAVVMVFELVLKLNLQEVQALFNARVEFEFSDLLAVPEPQLKNFLASLNGYLGILGQLLES